MKKQTEPIPAHFRDIQKPYAFDLFTPQEKKLIQYFNGRSIFWLSGWYNGAVDPYDDLDSEIWGLKHADMKTLALRVLRHKTGAMPIPELSDKPPIFQREPGEIPRILNAVKALIGENSIAKESVLSLESRLENLRAYLVNLVATSKI